MTPIDDILERIGTRWAQTGADAIQATIDRNNLRGVYVATFSNFYSDYCEFFAPHLCLYTEELHQQDLANGNQYRWSPSSWKHRIEVDDAADQMEPEYESLAKALTDEEDELWEHAIETHYQVIGAACRKLTDHFRSRKSHSTSPQFVVGIFEAQEGQEGFERLLRLSVDEAILAELPQPAW